MDKYLFKLNNHNKCKIIEEENDPDDPEFNEMQNIETPEVQPQQSLEDSQKSYLFNGQYFTIIQCDGSKLIAKCKNCFKVIRGQKTSTGNFLSHLKVSHYLYYICT